jgi:hypothetical protein
MEISSEVSPHEDDGIEYPGEGFFISKASTGGYSHDQKTNI